MRLHTQILEREPIGLSRLTDDGRSFNYWALCRDDEFHHTMTIYPEFQEICVPLEMAIINLP